LQGGGLFPTIDIKSGANTFISAGLDPLLMEINCSYSFTFTNNLIKTIGKHTLLFGGN
jgi:hypothetical protein